MTRTHAHKPKWFLYRDLNSYEVAMFGDKLEAVRDRIRLGSRERVIAF